MGKQKTTGDKETAKRAMAEAPWKNYSVGGVDRKNRRIDFIFSDFDNYVIYEADGVLLLDGDTERLDQSPQVNQLLLDIYSVTPMQPLPRRATYHHLASALDVCMAGDDEGAVVMLRKTLQRGRNLRRKKGQLRYLWGCILVAILVSLSYALIYMWTGSDGPTRSIVALAALGALGGVLSVATNLRTLEIDDESSALFNLCAGAARCVIAVIGALFLFYAIKANLLLGMIDPDASNGYALYAFAILAGFSETLVPRSLGQIEGSG